jgi:hypothetical protein
MKNLVITSVLLISFMFLLPCQGWAQETSIKENNSSYWFSLGFGGAFNTIESKKLAGRCLSSAIQYNKGVHLFTLEVSHVKTDHKSGGDWGDAFLAGLFGFNPPPIVITKSNFTEFKLMYGLISKNSNFPVYGSVGASFLKASGDYTGDGISELSLPIEIGFKVPVKNVGVALSYCTNINSYSKYHAFKMSLIIDIKSIK